MDIREQMARAMCDVNGAPDILWEDWLIEADAALNLFRNPSDEMVEWCAEALKAVDSWRTWKGPDVHNVAARACLKAAAGGE